MPEVRSLPSAGITRPHRSYGPVRHPSSRHLAWRSGWRTPLDRASPDNPCHLACVLCPTTPADRDGCACRLPSPSRAAFPVLRAGRHPRRYFRGLLGLYSRYGPHACSTAQGGLCHRAPARSLAGCLSATRPNRLLSRWNLPPLVTRAFGAHRNSEAQYARLLRPTCRYCEEDETRGQDRSSTFLVCA